MFMNGRRPYYALNSQRSNAFRRLHRYGSAQRKAPCALVATYGPTNTPQWSRLRPLTVQYYEKIPL